MTTERGSWPPWPLTAWQWWAWAEPPGPIVLHMATEAEADAGSADPAREAGRQACPLAQGDHPATPREG